MINRYKEKIKTKGEWKCDCLGPIDMGIIRE